MANPALEDQSDEVGGGAGGAFLNAASHNIAAGSSPASSVGGIQFNAAAQLNGSAAEEAAPLSLPLSQVKARGLLEKQSNSADSELQQHTTVITVRATEADQETGGGGKEAPSQLSPSDRTSLLGKDHSVS